MAHSSTQKLKPAHKRLMLTVPGLCPSASIQLPSVGVAAVVAAVALIAVLTAALAEQGLVH